MIAHSVGHCADRRRNRRDERTHFADMVHADFKARGLMFGTQFPKHQRDAKLIVQVAFGSDPGTFLEAFFDDG